VTGILWVRNHFLDFILAQTMFGNVLNVSAGLFIEVPDKVDQRHTGSLRSPWQA
jgi:hypothetical protein